MTLNIGVAHFSDSVNLPDTFKSKKKIKKIENFIWVIMASCCRITGGYVFNRSRGHVEEVPIFSILGFRTTFNLEDWKCNISNTVITCPGRVNYPDYQMPLDSIIYI